MRGEIFKTIIDNYKQLFLSRHTARTICLIRIAHSSVRQFMEYMFLLKRMQHAALVSKTKILN